MCRAKDCGVLSKMTKAIAIITARGGSKRIPRKNVKLFLGKPIIEYSIHAALISGVFDEVMVSTDDEEIAKIAKRAGAVVPFYRSAATSNDYATTADVLLEVLKEYEKRGKHFTKVCCIYPTAPFLTGDVLKEAMGMIKEESIDSIIPVVKFSFPPQRAVILKEDCLVPKWPEHMEKRSQDLEPFYHDCGQFYCLNTASFLEQRELFMKRTKPFFIPEIQVQDIDTNEDWQIAELKYKVLNHISSE